MTKCRCRERAVYRIGCCPEHAQRRNNQEVIKLNSQQGKAQTTTTKAKIIKRRVREEAESTQGGGGNYRFTLRHGGSNVEPSGICQVPATHTFTLTHRTALSLLFLFILLICNRS